MKKVLNENSNWFNLIKTPWSILLLDSFFYNFIFTTKLHYFFLSQNALCELLCSSLFGSSDSAAWLTEGWHAQGSWDEARSFDLCPAPLASFTLSALSVETNTLHYFFLVESQMDWFGYWRDWERMIEWVRESEGCFLYFHVARRKKIWRKRWLEIE